MDNLKALRSQLDGVDETLVKLLNERCKISQEIGKSKKTEQSESNTHFYAPARELQVFEKISTLNSGPLDNDSLTSIYREIISASLSLQHELKVGYLGPPGTYSHQAALERFGESVKLVPCDSIEGVFAVVESGKCDYGVVPLENSTVGSINMTFDRFLISPLKIRSETQISINHCLLSQAQSAAQIKRVYSHPEALKQCKKWLDKHSHLESIPVVSTSLAAELASKDEEAASVSSKVCVKLYPSLKILQEGIQDESQNSTRFAVLASDSDKPTGSDKTLLWFQIDNKRPGALCDALQSFKEHGINLTNILSRPSRSDRWTYVFFVEFTGHCDNANIKRCLEAFGRFTFASNSITRMIFPDVIASNHNGPYQISSLTGPLSPKDFLLGYPSGAYTTMRTVDQKSLLEFSMHVTRLHHAIINKQFKTTESEYEESELVASKLSPFRKDRELLDAWIRESCTKLISKFISSHSTDMELKLTILIYIDPLTQIPTLVGHIDQLVTFTGDETAVDVEIQGSPRRSATTKDSQWVRDRDKLIQKKFDKTHEILLHQDNGIYEGLTSNFFAVRNGKLYTAPLDVVLPGTIQKLVFEACQKIGVEIIYEFPQLDSVDEWEGAFLTSTSRIVLNIGRVYTPADRWVDLNSTGCQLIRDIRRTTWDILRQKAEYMLL